MKNILLSLAIFFLPLICFGSELSVADSSIVALWHFNEGSGTTTYDSSANKNYGELKNGAVFVTGRTGFYNEINFDGVNDSVETSSSTVWNFTSNPFMVFLTIKRGQTGAVVNESVIRNSSGTSSGWNFHVNSGILAITFYGVATINDTVGITDLIRHRVGFGYDGSTVYIFKDGIVTKSQSSGGVISAGNTGLIFGSPIGGSGHNAFTGTVDEVVLRNEFNLGKMRDDYSRFLNRGSVGFRGDR